MLEKRIWSYDGQMNFNALSLVAAVRGMFLIYILWQNLHTIRYQSHFSVNEINILEVMLTLFGCNGF